MAMQAQHSTNTSQHLRQFTALALSSGHEPTYDIDQGSTNRRHFPLKFNLHFKVNCHTIITHSDLLDGCLSMRNYGECIFIPITVASTGVSGSWSQYRPILIDKTPLQRKRLGARLIQANKPRPRVPLWTRKLGRSKTNTQQDMWYLSQYIKNWQKRALWTD